MPVISPALQWYIIPCGLFCCNIFLAFDASISPALHDTSVLMAGFLLQHFMAFCASISPALHETSVLMAGYLQLVALFSSRLVCLYKSRMCAISDLLAGSLHHAVFSSPAAFHALLSRIIYVFDDEAKLMPMAALCIQLLTVVSGKNGVIPHWPACFFLLARCWNKLFFVAFLVTFV